MLPFNAFLDELEKLGAISTDDARRSYDRLDTLEQNKPTLGQIGRYGALGAGAGALTKTLGNAIEHKALPSARAAGAGALAGAIGMGAVPLIRQKLDQRAEYGKLKKFMHQEHLGEYGASPGAMTDSPTTAGLSR
jgi:hypothetical protein